MNNFNIIICVVYVLFVRVKKGNNLFPLICLHTYPNNAPQQSIAAYSLNSNPIYEHFVEIYFYIIIVVAHPLSSIPARFFSYWFARSCTLNKCCFFLLLFLCFIFLMMMNFLRETRDKIIMTVKWFLSHSHTF